ncbi:MAG: HupE/UreJ family protein [Bauldia sp.]|nr:HupE/UreJ family protein [Bauldia sp.]
MMKRLPIAAAVLVLSTLPAFAHLDPGEHGSFLAGFTHPLTGLDHILVMVAVGLWAATIGGRALWVVPAAFVGTMGAGYLLSLTGVALPAVEPVILASVVALGLVVAMAVKLPPAAAAVLVGVFALFHGHAHGGEIGAATAASFGFGFAIATALLHAAGLGLGIALGRGLGFGEIAGKAIARILGAGAAVVGLVLAFGG